MMIIMSLVIIITITYYCQYSSRLMCLPRHKHVCTKYVHAGSRILPYAEYVYLYAFRCAAINERTCCISSCGVQP